MWHLSQYSKRLEFLIRPSNFGYNSYNQAIYVKIPDQIIPYLDKDYYINFVDVEGNVLWYFPKKFFPETNTVEYYVKLETIDDVNYTKLFVYYDFIGVDYGYAAPFTYATLDPATICGNISLENGNLTAKQSRDCSYSCAVKATESNSIGKWYWEVYIVSQASQPVYNRVGIGRPTSTRYLSYQYDSSLPGDVVGIALDLDNGKLWFSVNGNWVGGGDPAEGTNPSYTGLTGTFFPMISFAGFYPVNRDTIRFDPDSFSYTAPDGFNLILYNISLRDVFSGVYIVNFLDTTDLISVIGADFSNHSASLRQPICGTYAVKTSVNTSYISCSINKSTFTLFFNCYLVSGQGYLVYFSSINYVYVNSDGSLTVKVNNSVYSVGAKLYSEVCSSFSLTCDSSKMYVVINGNTVLTLNTTFSISEIRLGGNGTSGYTIVCYFWDLFLFPYKLSLYSYYLHNTTHNNSSFIIESGYDNSTINGYLTSWPEVIFYGDKALFRANMDLPVGWKYYRPITITNSGVETLYDYNVVVGLSTDILGNPYNNISGNGSDICFTSVGGISLTHYLYSWDETGDSIILVNSSGTGGIPVGDSYIYMYYYGEHSISTSVELEYPVEVMPTSLGDEVDVGGVLIYIEDNIYEQDVNYSVSFNNGSSWHFSSVEHGDVFYKNFSSVAELSTILRLNYGAYYIDKNYITIVNDFNQFSYNYEVDFLVGSINNSYKDVVSHFVTALSDNDDVDSVVAEYVCAGDAGDLFSYIIDNPVEFSYDDDVGSSVISKTVEYCFDSVKDSWFDDVPVNFWLGQVWSKYHVDAPVSFVLESFLDFYEDINIDLVLSNWKYFPNHTSIICSLCGVENTEAYIGLEDGRLFRFLSDVRASDMEYICFNSSVFCSLQDNSFYYLSYINVISGSLSNYESFVECSVLDVYDYGIEVKLNTVVIENFSINVGTVVEGPSFCFTVDVYDTHYNVTYSGISIYMNTNIINSNEVNDVMFTPIDYGYTAHWCYDVSTLSPADYIEVVVFATNTINDHNSASYFLRYGKRYYYNLYHITKHDFGKLIPMLMVAENNVDLFPSFSTESLYVRTESYKRSNLSASIFGVDIGIDNLSANLDVVTTNFYNGGTYKVRIECSDLSGNVMIPFEFEFFIRNDGQ